MTSKAQKEHLKRHSKKGIQKRVPQGEPPRSLGGPPPPPETAEGSALLEAILVKIPFNWSPTANPSAAPLG